MRPVQKEKNTVIPGAERDQRIARFHRREHLRGNIFAGRRIDDDKIDPALGQGLFQIVGLRGGALGVEPQRSEDAVGARGGCGCMVFFWSPVRSPMTRNFRSHVGHPYMKKVVTREVTHIWVTSLMATSKPL